MEIDAPGPPEDDVYEELEGAVREHWPAILMMYERFADKRPVMLFDLEEQLIYAYPYTEFRADLNARSQRLLKEQYESAAQQDQIVVFVRDNQEKRLVSFAFDYVAR
jgi:hypothetical protein